MKRSHQVGIFLLFAVVVVCISGCAMATIKQLSRNNLNEETISTIVRCRTTRDEIIDLFRAPTDDFMRKQGEYDVYIYKGFGGNLEIKEQLLEVMLNDDGVVVDYRFNEPDGDAMIDWCAK